MTRSPPFVPVSVQPAPSTESTPTGQPAQFRPIVLIGGALLVAYFMFRRS